MYCVYLTVYKGNKLPIFYIGSTSISKIQNGYFGSVKSKKYKDIWLKELKNNKSLFNVKIISIHNSREEALNKENIFHEYLNVHNNPLYINLATAKGKFGLLVSGFKGSHTEETKRIIREKRSKQIISKETRIKQRLSLKGHKVSESVKQQISKKLKGRVSPMKGRIQSKETILKRIETRKRNKNVKK